MPQSAMELLENDFRLVLDVDEQSDPRSDPPVGGSFEQRPKINLLQSSIRRNLFPFVANQQLSTHNPNVGLDTRKVMLQSQSKRLFEIAIPMTVYRQKHGRVNRMYAASFS